MAKGIPDRVRFETYFCGIHSAGGVPIAFAPRVSLPGGGLVSWLTRLLSSAPWEPVILLDCALSLWAILRFRPGVLQLSASSPGSTIMRCKLLIIPVYLDSCSPRLAAGSRSTEYLERWITEGGPLKIQGMSYSMTPDNVLTDFVTRLQDSPWGLSCLYAAVLNNLRPKEQKA